MRARHIDFTRESPREPLTGWALLCLGIVTLIGLVVHDTREQSKHSADSSRIDIAQTGATGKQVLTTRHPDESEQPSITRDRRWQKAMLELNFPWVETLAEIEKSTRPPVLLIGIKPEPSADLLTLEAESPSFSEMLKYVARLQKSVTFSSVTLQRHQETAGQREATAIRFVVQARWGKK